MSVKNDILSIEYANSKYDFKISKSRLLSRYMDILSCCSVSREEQELLEMYISVPKNKSFE